MRSQLQETASKVLVETREKISAFVSMNSRTSLTWLVRRFALMVKRGEKDRFLFGDI